MNRLEEFYLQARAAAPEMSELQVVPPEARAVLYPHRWFVFWTSVVVACARLSEPPLWIFRPPAQEAFNAGWANYQIGYSLSIIVFVLFMLAGGALGDAFGRRRVMIWGAALALGANLLLFVSPASDWFTVTRVIAGVGGALAMPLVIVHIVFAFPITARILALGIYTLITLLTASLVPQLQALLYRSFDWRVVFVLPIVLGLVGVWMVSRLPVESRVQVNRRIDILGHISFALLALAMLYGVTQSRAAGSWLAEIVVVSLVLAGLGMIGLLVWNYRTSRSGKAASRIPRYDLTVLIVVGMLMTFGAAVFAGQPRAFFQVIVGLSPIVAVLAYTPLAVGMLITILLLTRIARRITPRVQIAGGFVLMAVASAGVTLAVLPQLMGISWLIAFVMMLIFGCGFVLTNTAWIVAFTLTARQGINGVNAAINQATAQIGWVVGTAIASDILLSTGRAEIERMLLSGGIPAEQAATLVQNLNLFVQPGPPFLFDLTHTLTGASRQVYMQAYSTGVNVVMWTVAGLLLLGALVTWFGLRRAEQRVIMAQRGTVTYDEIISNQVEPLEAHQA